MLTLEPNPRAVRHILDDDFDWLRARDSSVEKAIRRCVTCAGKGVFRWRDETGQPADYTCDCDEQLLLYLYLMNAGLGLRYQRLSWDDATGVDDKAVGEIVGYATRAEIMAQHGRGLTLHSQARGTGKTLVATLLLKKLLASGFNGYFVMFQDMIDLYTSTWRKDDEKAWFERKIRNAGVLVVDDMGREYEGRIEMVQAMFDGVLRARVNAQRPTIITTNKTITELGQLYSLNALSLLDEVNTTVEFGTEDFRRQKGERDTEEITLGLTRPVVLS